MNRERADRIFDAALDLPEGEREAFVARECGDDAELRALVVRLLAHAEETTDGWLTGGAPAAPIPGDDRAGTRLGAYRILREVGRGGMAVVYEAERADGEYEDRVAIKLIRRGLDSESMVRRFERERQILARIRHPNIARLLDGGTTDDGLPYLVMEFVDGVPIDRHCDERRLSVEDRVRLFLGVCDALAHAHRNLVVHRDVKPSNILVDDDGNVRLLDFGIARLVESDEALTRTGMTPLTPAFSSPEQVRGEPVTTASDVYQMGVLLYLILTGRMPYPGEDAGALAHAICSVEPTRPSTAVSVADDAQATIGERRATTPSALRRALAGDLDTILMVALRKEPDRRYLSMTELMHDLEAFLDDRPISARPDSFAYRARKFVGRNRLAVGLAGVAALALAVSAVTATVQARRIAGERDRANLEAETARRVSDFLVDLFRLSNPGKERGESITAREVLDRGAEQIEGELAGQPVVRARLMDTIGRVYQNLGLYDDARPLIEGSLALRRSELGDAHADTVESLDHLAWLHEQTGDWDAAEPLYREALERTRARAGERSEAVAGALNNLALLLYRKDDPDGEAESTMRRALALRRDLLEPGDARIGDTLSNLGLILDRKGDDDEAERVHLEALEIRRAALPEDDPRIAISLDNLGRLYSRTGDYETAERYMLEALAIRRRVLETDHPDMATSLNNVAALHFFRGELDAAIPLMEEVVAIDRRVLGEDHPDYALGLGNLGVVNQRAGNLEAAERHLREALAVLEGRLDEGHFLVGLMRGNLGDCLLARGRVDEAEPLLRDSLRILESGAEVDDARVEAARERVARLEAARSAAGSTPGM